MPLASVSSTHQGLAAPRLPHMQHFAAEGGHAAVIAALLKGKATVDAKTMGGLTPLHKAAEAGRPEAVAALLEGGASPDVQASPPSSSMRCVLVLTPWRRWIAGMFNLIPYPALLFPSWLVADCYTIAPRHTQPETAVSAVTRLPSADAQARHTAATRCGEGTRRGLRGAACWRRQPRRQDAGRRHAHPACNQGVLSARWPTDGLSTGVLGPRCCRVHSPRGFAALTHSFGHPQ